MSGSKLPGRPYPAILKHALQNSWRMRPLRPTCARRISWPNTVKIGVALWMLGLAGIPTALSTHWGTHGGKSWDEHCCAGGLCSSDFTVTREPAQKECRDEVAKAIMEGTLRGEMGKMPDGRTMSISFPAFAHNGALEDARGNDPTIKSSHVSGHSFLV
jgi:hypothetical protein